MPSSPWKSKTALVCGATDGIGRELAEELCRQSLANLVLVARNETRLRTTREQLARQYPHTAVSTHTTDMCQTDQVAQLAESLRHLHPQLDLLIQAVGKSDRGRLQDLTRERLLELIDANVCSSLNAINLLSSVMGSPSNLVLIGSLACHFAPRFLGGYAIAKHALAGLAQQSRLELVEHGIHVTLASPGPIRRADAGSRYQGQTASENIPQTALQPGGGARIAGLEPRWLAQGILRATAKRKPLCVFPAKANLLRILIALAPAFGEQLLRKNSS